MAQKSSKQKAEEAVLDLKGKLRQLNNALAGKGATITDNAPLVATIKAVEGVKAGGEEIVLTLYKESQFEYSPDERLPPMKVSDKSPSTSIPYALANMRALRELPEITGLERCSNAQAICRNNVSLSSATMGDLPLASNISYAFSGCLSIESISIGDAVVCTSFEHFSSSCVKLKRLTIGTAPNATNIYCMEENCVQLEEITASFGDKLNSVGYAFSNCKSLRRINGVLNFSGAGDYRGSFAGCTSLEEVRIKGAKADIDLSACGNLSVESVRYLVENAQSVTGKRIDLSRKLLDANEEALGDLGDTASDKGWVINYK